MHLLYFRPQLDQENRKKRENILFLMYEIRQEEPFTAMGFFNIELSTLTSIVSTILTYVVVLVQFQQTNTPMVSN